MWFGLLDEYLITTTPRYNVKVDGLFDDSVGMINMSTSLYI